MTNPLTQAQWAIAKLIGLLLVAALLVWGVMSLFGSRAQLIDIKKTDARIAAGNKQANADAKKRDNAAQSYFVTNQSQATALAKDLSHENAVFDDRARAEYFRVLNDALRGPKP